MNKYELARKGLIGDLQRYLVGPLGASNEILSEPAWDRYHVGMLFPSGSPVPPEEDDQVSGVEAGPAESGSDDGILALANVARQAAAGLTFQVMAPADVLADLEYAEYVPEWRKAEAAGTPDPAEAEGHAGGASPPRSRLQWQRKSHSFKAIEIPGASDAKTLSGSRGVVLRDDDNIQLVCNRRISGNVCTVTLSIVNRRPAPDRDKKRKPDELPVDRAIYQVRLRVYSHNSKPVFVARPPGIHISDPEFVVHELLYRNVKQFAVGHGCAVDWKLADGDVTRATEVWLEWVPSTEVRKASAVVPSLSDMPSQDLEFLGQMGKRAEICEALDAVVSEYRKWIAGLKAMKASLVASFDTRIRQRIDSAADENISQCERVARRMEDGIGLLRTDELVFESFCLANLAMANTMRKARPGDRPRWFPFQIAFLLMSVPSTINPAHDDRHVMDLIWFPTGGGKTEAYLALVSLVLFYRRLKGNGSQECSGTAVLTRYTLRLLTVQQFERAARTIMACELLRRKDEKRFGKTTFSIGLFVGNSATPRDLKTAREIIDGRTQPDETATTLPLSKCPWCSSPLSFRNQKVTSTAVVTSCPDAGCEFHGGIPFACTDEELFQAPPSMIIGTVDKFAMMAWEPGVAEFFGSGSANRAPPSLIIQDELHLISDALGTITALYETAIDHLCTRDGRGPKVIGSTATIRRAAEQARRLYARTVQQFPPSGLDYNDSFFYGEDRSNPGRTYVGVHAQGRSPKYTLARLMGILAQGALSITDEEARDQFYTLVAYFNSLRELGGAIVLAHDDVRRYIEAMPDAGKIRRRLDVIQELTSYLPSQEIPAVLALMATGLVKRDPDSAPIDLVLSTNMISVGVDVDRLGLMIVNGQPKTTSEYIQASSRVGRPKGSAGLVVTLYNWTRPRDRSHYERFRNYHESFYRYVEATSVTPFSPRARDRALHGVLFALTRMTIPGLSGSPVLDDSLVAEVRGLCEVLARRAEHVEPGEAEATRAHLDDLLDRWQSGAVENATWRKEKKMGPYFLVSPSKLSSQAVFDATPQSMRDVDPPSPVRLLSSGELAKAFGGDDQ